MKKIICSVLIIMIFLVNSTQMVYAASKKSSTKKSTKTTTSTSSSTWVQDAFTAANSFFHEDVNNDVAVSIGKPILKQFKNIVRGINSVLLVLLGALSAISISITGVRYMMSPALPEEREKAKHNLKTAFKGMAIGFGAFLIWRISMGIVEIIIQAF